MVNLKAICNAEFRGQIVPKLASWNSDLRALAIADSCDWIAGASGLRRTEIQYFELGIGEA